MKRSYTKWPDGMTLQEKRRERKRQYRRAQGCELRVEIHERALAKSQKKNGNIKPHDAHVKKRERTIKDRERAALRYANDADCEKARQRAIKEGLPDSYVRYNLTAIGIPKSEITPQLIELKRAQMIWRRLALQLKRAAHKHYKEIYEAIPKHP